MRCVLVLIGAGVMHHQRSSFSIRTAERFLVIQSGAPLILRPDSFIKLPAKSSLLFRRAPRLLGLVLAMFVLLTSALSARAAGEIRSFVATPGGGDLRLLQGASVGISAIFFPIIITAEPTNQVSQVGGTVSFSVTAAGQGPFRYQWLKNDAAIDGATNNTLTLSNVQITDVGEYRVLVLTARAALPSQRATLTLEGVIPPLITEQPTNQSQLLGTEVNLVVAALSLEPLEYQWLKDAQRLTNATNATLHLAAVALSDAGSYAVVISNRLGTVTSATAVLEVNSPPIILTQPSSRSARSGESIDLTVEAIGSSPLIYQWFKDGASIVEATNAVLRFARVESRDTGIYQVTIRNNFGTAASEPATLLVNAAPTFVSQPENQTLLAGGTATLSAEVTGLPPLTLQWFKDGQIVLGANRRTLTFSPAQPSDSGTYRLLAINEHGSTVSSNAVLRVDVPLTILLQPSSQSVLLGSQASFTVGAVGAAPLRYRWFKNNELITGFADRVFAIPRITLADAGRYKVEVRDFNSVLMSAEATLEIIVPVVITRHPESQAVISGVGVSFAVEAATVSSARYQWFKNDLGIPGANNSILTIDPVRPSDAGQYKVLVANEHGGAASAEAVLIVYQPPIINVQPVSAGSFLGGSVLFTVDASGTPPLSFQWYRNGTPIPSATDPNLRISSIRVSDTGNYRVSVSNAYGAANSRDASLTLDVFVAITAQPLGRRVKAGDDVSFSVETSSLLPVNYQWFRNGSAISGANGQSILLRGVTADLSGVYSVEVSNALGRAVSSGAALVVDVLPPPRSDFNGDGWPDLVFQDEDGFLASWWLRNDRLDSAAFLIPQTAGDRNWSIVASGDFDQNGAEDLLFQHSDGALAFWRMRGRELESVASIENGGSELRNWRVVGTGDFDADKKLDLVFQHTGGTLLVRRLEGFTAGESLFLNPNHPGDERWRVAAVGDLNGDGHDDLIFQHANGDLAVWLLVRTTLSSTAFLNPRHPGDAQWRTAGALDFNRDGHVDLLFQHAINGELAVWQMEGLSLRQARALNPPRAGGSWKVVVP